MDEKRVAQSRLSRGRIHSGDRIQRLVSGGALMALTISGLIQHIEWRGLLALTIQAELLLTGLAGWCPMYWACSTKR